MIEKLKESHGIAVGYAVQGQLTADDMPALASLVETTIAANKHPIGLLADISQMHGATWAARWDEMRFLQHHSDHIAREGAAKPMVFDLIRDEIPHNSIDLSYMIRPNVGYVHITNFQETTGRELSDALDHFGNMDGLVLDLRGNPGGLLSEAVAVCDKFLEKGQVIVSQRGRAFPEQTYRATHGNGGREYPIVVLVNHGTASAAEIVSGALQDHDRAIIAGETTFGKGLVQTVYPLSENTGLALTTYHYYTPSGRLIQRNYNGVSLYDYYYNHDQPQDVKSREVKATDSGRTVFGGRRDHAGR